MGDVATQPQTVDPTAFTKPLPRGVVGGALVPEGIVGSSTNRPDKLTEPLQVGSDDFLPSVEDAETPCRVRKVEGGNVRFSVEYGGGSRGAGSGGWDGGCSAVKTVEGPISGSHLAGRASAGGFPRKDVVVIGSRPRSPSTESDTASLRGSAGNADTDTDASPQQSRRKRQQQQQQQEPEFRATEIRRVASTAESVVDVWAPSLVTSGGGSKRQQRQRRWQQQADSGSFDEQSTVRWSRTPGSRASLSAFTQMFMSANAGAASADDEGPAASRPSDSIRGSLSRIFHSFASTSGGSAGEGGEKRHDSIFDTENPMYGADREAVVAGDDDDTIDLGRPASMRGTIPVFPLPEEGKEYATRPTDGLAGVRAIVASSDAAVAVAAAAAAATATATAAITEKPPTLDSAGSSLPVNDLGGSTVRPREIRVELKEDQDGSGTAGEVVARGLETTARESVAAAAAVGAPPLKVGSPADTDLASSDAGTETDNFSATDARDEDVDTESDAVATEDSVAVVAAAAAVASPASPEDAVAAAATADAAVTDNRISPFDADNAALWATAAAASAAAEDNYTSPDDAEKSTLWSRAAAAISSTSSTAAAKAPPLTIPGKLRRIARGMGVPHVSISSRVFPGKRASFSHSGPLPPLPHSGAFLPPLPHSEQPGKNSRTPSFGGDGYLGKTPLVSPTWSGTTAGDDDDDDTASSAMASSDSILSPRSASLARGRRELEGDVEEGGVRAAAAAAAAGGANARIAVGAAGVSARVAAADVAAALAAAAPTAAEAAVLPCAPSDDEKIIYRSTGRLGLVSCAMLSFVVLTWGMWLFTIVTPAFYWFGAPAVFIIIYTLCHYLGVAVWGRDFRLDQHAEVVRRSEERGYRPAVDVYLPVCKEPLHLLANTWKHVAALDYDPGALKVYVLDDGRSEQVKALAAAFGFEYVLRANAPELKKAGNLRNAFAMTTGEAIAIFDADFCPRPDFLKETVPYLGEDPTVGIVQTPQFFRYREEQTWIEKGAGVTQEFFYRMVQVNQDKFNAAVCVGSCGLYRRKALEPLGGMAAIEHSEDMYTGFKMTEHGFKIKYIPLALAMGICPDEPQSFFMQQYRWCKGSACLVADKDFWASNISNIHKLCFMNGMLYYMATALLIFLAPIPILLLVWMRADGVLWFHSAFMIPSLLFAGVIMPMWSKQPYGMAAHRVKVIQCYAHLYAIKDTFMGTHAPWVPSGAGTARSKSGTYKSSVRLLVVWNIIVTGMVAGGSAWRMAELTWYQFLPAMAMAIGSFALNMSTLVF